MAVGLGTWSLARAALIILLLPRSECGRVGAVVRGELRGEIAGLEERSMSLRCHTAPGDPRESQENEAGPQMWGRLGSHHRLHHEEWGGDQSWSAWKRLGVGAFSANLCQAVRGTSGFCAIFTTKGSGKFHPGIRKARQSPPTLQTLS